MEKEIKIRVFPGAHKEKFSELDSDMFDAYVREPAQKNLANTRVRELVAEKFGVSLARVIISRGHKSRSKFLRIKP